MHADKDTFHAIEHYIRDFADQGDEDVVMFLGSARSGAVLKVGVVEDDDDPRIMHALPARAKSGHEAIYRRACGAGHDICTDL